MPVNALAPADAAATNTSAVGTATAGAPVPADGSFDQLLGQHLGSPSRAPTVTLAGMVNALAGQAIEHTQIRADLSPASVGGAAAARAGAVADDWGVSTDRPDLANAGAGAAVLAAGEQYLGVPYKWGGTSASSGFDCSGFVQRAFADVGVSLPRVSIDQSRQGVAVPGGLAGAQPGDLLFWGGSNGRPNHIAIYAGDNRMLVAPRTGDVVRYQEVTRTPDAVRRVL